MLVPRTAAGVAAKAPLPASPTPSRLPSSSETAPWLPQKSRCDPNASLDPERRTTRTSADARGAAGFVDAANVPAARMDGVVPAVLVDAGAEAGGRRMRAISINKEAPYNHGASVGFTSYARNRPAKRHFRQAVPSKRPWGFRFQKPTHQPRYPCKMASVVYRCPTTGKSVQAWFDEDDTPADNILTYVSLRGPACARLHLVNRTGRTLRLPV
jgi:hypothetical protein